MDLEGTAAKIVLLAVSQADLVVVPTQGSQLDAEQASRALKVIKQQEKMSGRTVPYGVAILMVCVSPYAAIAAGFWSEPEPSPLVSQLRP